MSGHRDTEGRAYDLQHLSGRARHVTILTDYSAFAVTPCAIDTPHGSIRFLGFPLLEGFAKEHLKSDEAFRNAAAYLTATQFQDLSGFQPGAILRESKELMTADDGQLRKDWSMSGDSDLSGKQLFERSVAPGEMVCLIGCYSAERRGLAPNLNVGAVRLVRGDPQTAGRALWWRTVHGVVGSLVIAALLNGGLYGYLHFFAGSSGR